MGLRTNEGNREKMCEEISGKSREAGREERRRGDKREEMRRCESEEREREVKR